MIKMLSFILIIYLSIPLDINAEVKDQDSYAKGLEILESGDWLGALKCWQAGYAKLIHLERVDPRIGIAYIELATQREASGFYDIGSDIYMWGFSGEVEEYKEYVLEEAKRIIPLLSGDEKKQWNKLIQKSDDGLAHSIKKYWLERDPRPITTVNERLIEHWQRIADARTHFNHNNYGVYDCDDRGTVYVKYGRPDKKKSGRFGSSSESRMELMIRVRGGNKRGDISFLDHTPEYEVWGYDSIGARDTGIFLFSNRNGLGRFGLVRGIESLYRWKGYVYQIMYYAELRSFDRFFSDRYSTLRYVWEDNFSGIGSRYLLWHEETKNRLIDRYNPNSKYAAPDKSDFEGFFGTVDMESQFVRFIDDNNKSKLAVLAAYAPEFKNIVPGDIESEAAWQDFKMRNVIIARNSKLGEIERIAGYLPDKNEMISAFLLDHTNTYKHLSLAAEAVDNDERVLALGRRSYDVPQPLTLDHGELELSDLLIGSQTPAEIQEQGYPMPVVPSSRFKTSDGLQFYIEIYNMLLDEKGNSKYSLEYGITRIKKKGHRIKKYKKVSTSYDFAGRSTRSEERLAIDISKLKEGQYLFEVKVTDKTSGKDKVREAMFEVVKE